MGVGKILHPMLIPLREVPRPMAAEASPGTNQRLTLDHSSFEKLLAAAWVLQCLQDQLHNSQLGRDETIANPVKVQKEIESASPVSHPVAEPMLQPLPKVSETDSKHDSINVRPKDNEIFPDQIDTPKPVETGMLYFDAAEDAAKIEAVESQKNLRSEDPATPDPVNAPRAASLTNRARVHNHKWATPRAALGNVLTSLSRGLDGCMNLLPTFRVNLSLRDLRAVAIAMPIWLLSLVAAVLFLAVWRHGSFQSAQSTSTPTPPTVEASVRHNSPILASAATATSTAKPLSTEVKRTNHESQHSRTVTSLEVSHQHITDPTALSAVEQLSRYEIPGLRRRAKYGDESAAFTLGMAYEVGHSVPQNCVEAARWVATAAEAGDVAAQYNLGLRYRDGDGVPANRAESEKWLRRAATRKNRQAKQALRMLASR
jgi:TPR repeat protein